MVALEVHLQLLIHKHKTMAIGVYKITNLINGKFYIGSTRRLSERKNEHNYSMRKGRSNSIIRNAILKYGYENFKFEVLDEFIFENFASTNYIDEIITAREQYYVDTLNPQYNIKKIDVTNNKGVIYIDGVLTEDKISIRERARLFPKNYGRTKIDIYETDTLIFIETVMGIRECARKYKINNNAIIYHCKNGYVNKPHINFLFCYHNANIKNAFKNRKENKKYVKKNTTPIIQIDKEGNFIKEWRTMQDAQIALGLYRGSVCRVISGEYSHTNGYYFKLKN